MIMAKRLILVVLLIPSIAHTAPDVTGATGAISNGQSITVSGTGFGVKTSAAPLISSYDSAISANNWSTGSFGSNWEMAAQGDDPVLSTTSPRSTQTQSSYKVEYNAAGSYSVIGYNHASRSDVSYVSWWTYNGYAAFDGADNDGNGKWMRFYTSSGDGNGLYFSNQWDESSNFDKTYSVPEYAPDCSSWSIAYTGTAATLSASSYFRTNFGDADQDNTMQEWVHWELYNIYDTNLEGGDDTAVLLKNGETVFRAIDVSLQKSDSNDDQRNLRLGQVSGGRSVVQMEYIDQIYYDNTISHIFISDASTLSFPDQGTAHHSEIQVASAWSATSVTFTLNQGTFAVDDTAYLYVVDSDGAVNATGYEITIGASSVGSTASLTCSKH